MKTLIAATLLAFASTGALAGSFEYERSIGSADLFPTLQSERGVSHHAVNGSSVFAYERSIGTPNLFVELNALRPDVKVEHNDIAIDMPVWRDIASEEADLHG